MDRWNCAASGHGCSGRPALEPTKRVREKFPKTDRTRDEPIPHCNLIKIPSAGCFRTKFLQIIAAGEEGKIHPKRAGNDPPRV